MVRFTKEQAELLYNACINDIRRFESLKFNTPISKATMIQLEPIIPELYKIATELKRELEKRFRDEHKKKELTKW